MEHYARSIIPVIEYNYENFTALERTIADFFIQNKKKRDFSAKAVSERLYVSEASLSRFAKKCGFRGYREFIYQYEDTFPDFATFSILTTEKYIENTAFGLYFFTSML